MFPLHNKIEILNDDLEPSEPDQPGKIYITTLNNFSMPLIRYDIGDMGVLSSEQTCSCGRGWPLIQKVIGRHIETFTTKDGRKIPGEFFIHFVGVVYNKNFVKRFQVVQKDYDYILVKLVVLDAEKFEEHKTDIISAIQRVMGQDCKVEFQYVEDIKPTATGKYLYTLSEVK
jgi:phenylacetate-CoA ligase